jgi:replicative DNA helicase
MASVPTAPASPANDPAPVALPHNPDAEAALIGALLLDNRLLEDVSGVVRPEHFHDPLFARLYTAIEGLTMRGMVASPVTLRPLFARDEAMAALGGPGWMASLIDSSAAMVGARDYARQIHELAQLRELVRVGREMATAALDPEHERSPDEQIEDAEMALYRVAEAGESDSRARTFAEAAAQAVAMAERARKSGGGVSGVTTGLTALDKLLGGLQNSDLVILAGRPGMGKTALATNIAFAAARKAAREAGLGADEPRNGAAVAFFSLEMSSDQLAARVLAQEAQIPSEELRRGKLDQTDFRNLVRAAQELETLPLIIDDTPGLTIAGLRARARRLKRRHQIGLVVVDYLQLMSGTSRRSNDNRVQEVSEITRGLKVLAKELGVPVVALSQLSRSVEGREGKRPVLADLRESGSIEQDADVVMFVFREEYYLRLEKPAEPAGDSSPDARKKWDSWEADMARMQGLAEVIVAKHRHGPTANVTLMFNGEYTKFFDLADDSRVPGRD